MDVRSNYRYVVSKGSSYVLTKLFTVLTAQCQYLNASEGNFSKKYTKTCIMKPNMTKPVCRQQFHPTLVLH